ncbi:alpha-galactosidase [Plantibacter sp. YIM 135347]|uniref:alpha-galactosidase n=1 Tax=Plantibacter sp. YIM 135347 TaxID=3423919 RepID=UPI003D340206
MSSESSPSILLHARAAGVSLLLDVSDGRLPVIHHWGGDLGTLTQADARAQIRATAPVPANNNLDVTLLPSVLPEQWTGWLGRPGLRGSRGGRDFSPVFVVDALRVNDEQGTGYLELDGTGASLTVEAVCADTKLALELTVELTAQGIVRQRATVTNHGETYQLDDLVLTLPLPTVATEILDFAGHWGLERVPQQTKLDVGTHLRENRKGRTGADSAYLLHAGRPGFDFGDGELWAVHTGFSGNHTHYAERLWTGAGVLGGGELLDSGEIVLGTGEQYSSPWVYFSHADGLDAVARRFHRFMRSRPQHPSTPRPVTINTWEAVYFDHDFERLADLARRAAALGIERYVLDDGWFGSRRGDRSGLGDWVVSADAWPDGLSPLVDLVTGLGMQFGLWFEPEMVNADSDVARAHPEWIIGASAGRWPIEARHQQVLDLAIPEAYAHVRDQMLAVLDEYDIAYIKWDHNRDLIEAGNLLTGRPATHEQTLAAYRLMDELKAAHPGLEIESCASGGGRVDLGVLERTDRVWVSDNIDPLDRQLMNRWTTQLIAPEIMGTHVASGISHTTHRANTLEFRAASALFGHFGVEWDLAAATEQETAELTAWIATHKELRDLLHSGDLVRLDVADPAWYAHGVVSEDRAHAVFSLALLASQTHSNGGAIRFAGLDPARRYLVTPVFPSGAPEHLTPWASEPTVLTGASLMRAGLELPALRPASAWIVRFDAD